MATDPNHAFGDLLRHHRLAANLTQEQLADRAGISPQAITTLERGTRHSPRKATLQRLLDALRLTGAERALLESAASASAPSLPRRAVRPDNPPPASRTTTPLVGRDDELSVIRRHLDGAGPPALFLAGEPGIGKSRLLAQAHILAAERRWRVLSAGCHRGSAALPYAPLLAAFMFHLNARSPAGRRADLRGCSWLARLLPELDDLAAVPAPSWSLPSDQERRLMFEAAGRFLTNIAASSGTLFILDDLQWAGSDAFNLLATLLRAPRSVPLRIVGAYRDTEAGSSAVLASALADLAAAGLGSHLPLGPLPLATAADLAAQLLTADITNQPDLKSDAELADMAAELVRRAGGVPFFLVSCAHDTHQRMDAEPAISSASEEPRRVPWDVAQSIRQRVEPLSASARELLRAVAVAQGPVPRAVLLAQAPRELSEEETITALESLLRARLLVEAGTEANATYRCAHDLIGETIRADLSAARRTLVHLRLAEAYLRQPGPPPLEALAYHFAHSGDDERAVDYLERAGDHARLLQAHITAQVHFQRLVILLDRLERAHAAALAREKLGAELAAQAHYAEALEVLECASAIHQQSGDEEGQMRVVAQIGNTHARRGTPAEGLARIGALLSSKHPAAPLGSLALLYDARAHLHFVAGQYDDELVAAEQLTRLVRVLDDAELMVAAEYWRADALDALGQLDEALEALSALIVHPASATQPWKLAHMLNKLAYIYQRRGEFTRSIGFHEQALGVARQFGDPPVISHMLVMLGMERFYAGDWEQGRTHIQEALDHIRQVGPTFRTPYPLLASGLIYLARGERVAALAFLEEALASGTRNGDMQALRYTQRALAEFDLLEGRPARARARLEPLLDRPGQRETLVTFVLPPLAWAYLDLDDIARAEALLRDGAQRADEQQFRVAQVEILQVRTLLETRRHHWRAAARAAHASLELCLAMPYPHGEIKALYAWGLMHIAQGNPTQARKRLEVGLAISRRLGERLYGERIERALANLGHR